MSFLYFVNNMFLGLLIQTLLRGVGNLKECLKFRLPNLHKKVKPWRILVEVVVK